MFGTVNPPATKFKRLLPPGQIFRDGPFLFLCRFCFPREKFATGCPRNDDSHLARPIAPPVLLIGRGPSAAEGQANHHHKPGSRNYDIVGGGWITWPPSQLLPALPCRTKTWKASP